MANGLYWLGAEPRLAPEKPGLTGGPVRTPTAGSVRSTA
jgi:hypothetical protein